MTCQDMTVQSGQDIWDKQTGTGQPKYWRSVWRGRPATARAGKQEKYHGSGVREKDSLDSTAGRRQPGQDSRERTVRTGQLERTVGIIQPGQVREDSKYKTVQGQSSKMGLDNSAWQVTLDRTERTRRPGHHRKDRAVQQCLENLHFRENSWFREKFVIWKISLTFSSNERFCEIPLKKWMPCTTSLNPHTFT